MSPQLPEKYFVVLERSSHGGRILVDLEAFARFDLWIDQEIALLEEQYGDLAAPRAWLMSRSSGSPK